MKYDYNPLRGKIREVLGSESNLATVIHMNRSTLSQKLNNLSGFTQQDMVDILEALKEPYCKAGFYFFTQKVSNEDEAPLIDVPEGSEEPDYGPEKIPPRPVYKLTVDELPMHKHDI